MTDRNNDPLWMAFKAGWDMSGEGYNSEYGGPTAGWLYGFYKHYVHGEPEPTRCSNKGPRNLSYTSMVMNYYCSFDRGHDGPHRAEQGVEWS